MEREEMKYWLAKGASALSLSVQKWRDIQEEVAERIALDERGLSCDHISMLYGSESCALCHTHDGPYYGCCIIEEATGTDQCKTTPYYVFHKAYGKGDLHGMKEAADAEIEFLEYLEQEEKGK